MSRNSTIPSEEISHLPIRSKGSSHSLHQNYKMQFEQPTQLDQPIAQQFKQRNTSSTQDATNNLPNHRRHPSSTLMNIPQQQIQSHISKHHPITTNSNNTSKISMQTNTNPNPASLSNSIYQNPSDDHKTTNLQQSNPHSKQLNEQKNPKLPYQNSIRYRSTPNSRKCSIHEIESNISQISSKPILNDQQIIHQVNPINVEQTNQQQYFTHRSPSLLQIELSKPLVSHVRWISAQVERKVEAPAKQLAKDPLEHNYHLKQSNQFQSPMYELQIPSTFNLLDHHQFKQEQKQFQNCIPPVVNNCGNNNSEYELSSSIESLRFPKELPTELISARSNSTIELSPKSKGSRYDSSRFVQNLTFSKNCRITKDDSTTHRRIAFEIAMMSLNLTQSQSAAAANNSQNGRFKNIRSEVNQNLFGQIMIEEKGKAHSQFLKSFFPNSLQRNKIAI